LGEYIYFSNSDKNKIIEEMSIWDISRYPGFFIKNNIVHYKETRKSKIQNLTKEELTINIYTLYHISFCFYYVKTKKGLLKSTNLKSSMLSCSTYLLKSKILKATKAQILKAYYSLYFI